MYRNGFSYQGNAYVLSPKGASKLLQLVESFRRNAIPLDELLPALYSRHPNSAVRRVYGEGTVLRSWAGKTHLVVPSASEAIARTDLPHY